MPYVYRKSLNDVIMNGCLAFADGYDRRSKSSAYAIDLSLAELYLGNNPRSCFPGFDPHHDPYQGDFVLIMVI